MAAEPDQPGQDARIDDPESLSQTKRITELLGRRKRVLDARDEALDALMLGKASREDALGYYRSRIESLILDLWTKFKNEDIENGREYLETREIDTIEVPPPRELHPDDGDLAPGESAPGPKYETIEGLRWFLNNDGAIQVPFTARMHDPPGSQTVVQEMQVPLSTLDKALMACIEFLDEIGVDADISQEEQQTKIDRELLEEVDEWRKQNVEN